MQHHPGKLLCFAFVDQGQWVAVCPRLDIRVRGGSRAEVKTTLRQELVARLCATAGDWHDRGLALSRGLTGAPGYLLRQALYGLERLMTRLSLLDPSVHQMYFESDPTVLVA
ncbi:MAG TPA: hypothetical protein VFA48_02170 [Gammaproteobacteria bacterium]|nr:hypothetical protein [Gammaproteobacteria bacterium]